MPLQLRNHMDDAPAMVRHPAAACHCMCQVPVGVHRPMRAGVIYQHVNGAHALQGFVHQVLQLGFVIALQCNPPGVNTSLLQFCAGLLQSARCMGTDQDLGPHLSQGMGELQACAMVRVGQQRMLTPQIEQVLHRPGHGRRHQSLCCMRERTTMRITPTATASPPRL